ncbi:MAG: DMT family transporter [Halarcobacter sp.]
MLEKKSNPIQLFILTVVTLIFLSANSVFCRAALVDFNIDAFSFTFFRLFFGALTLILILFFVNKNFKLEVKPKGNWLSSFMLFLYAIAFSYSYLNMEAGIGTLILFAVVQLTMIIIAIIKKETLTLKKALGIVIAFSGLVYLLYPSENFSLSLFHVFLMIISGIAWAFYTILGKKSTNALKDTTINFTKTIPYLVLFFILFANNIHMSFQGVFLAFLSGSVTSAIGYVLWYLILRNMEIITASVIQLIVPVLAIVLSIILLDEKLTPTLIISTSMILGGIFISIYKKSSN